MSRDSITVSGTMKFNIREAVLALVILLIAALWVAGFLLWRPEIEARLTKVTMERLFRYHYEDLTVSFSARKATLSGTVKSEERKLDVQFLVDSIYGVEGVNTDHISIIRRGPSDSSVAEIGLMVKAVNSGSGWIYLAVQIIVLLGAALLLGFLLGWIQIFGRSRKRDKPASMVSVSFYREKIGEMEEDLAKEAFRSATLECCMEKYQNENITLQAELRKKEDKIQQKRSSKKETPSQEVDDLMLLKGVGAILSQRLNDAGVYRFRQIAEWTAKDRRFLIGDIKGLEGTLKRYDLISQARKLF